MSQFHLRETSIGDQVTSKILFRQNWQLFFRFRTHPVTFLSGHANFDCRLQINFSCPNCCINVKTADLILISTYNFFSVPPQGTKWKSYWVIYASLGLRLPQLWMMAMIGIKVWCLFQSYSLLDMITINVIETILWIRSLFTFFCGIIW